MKSNWEDPNRKGCLLYNTIPPAPGLCDCGGEQALTVVDKRNIVVCCPPMNIGFLCIMQLKLFCYPCPRDCFGNIVIIA
jgi:hypothetical protein